MKRVLSNAKQLRQDHLESRADDASKEGKVEREKAIRIVIQAEEQRHAWCRMRRAMGKGKKSGLSSILVENEDGTTERITDKTDMEGKLIEQFQKHYSQADGTPFTQSPLTDILGRYGTTEEARWLFDGTFQMEDDPEIGEAAKSILRKLKKQDGTKDIRDHISADDLRQGYSKWRESTSTSPSGLHLGHEKALLRMENKPPKDGEEHLSERVFSLIAKFLNLAIEHCHVYKRWKKIINATIEKIPGTPLIHKLRVIHLIESDFNLMVGIANRRMMWEAEEQGSLGTEQKGSRKGEEAILIVVEKQAKFSISRMARTNIASLDNDAKSCFDRIVMLVASLCAQKHGMSARFCELFLSTLDQVKYHVKTSLGVSEASYKTMEGQTVHGPGQGGRGSPSIWVTISCLIMECLQEKSNGFTAADTDGKEASQTFSSGFVDDVTLWIGNMLRTLEGNDSASTILEETQTAAQWWESLLTATGGKLELSKCFFYLMYWVFNEEGESRLLEPEELPHPIEIVDSVTNETIRIETRSCSKAHKTLGVMESPNGDYKAETDRLNAKANEFARKASLMAVSERDATTLYFSMIHSSMRYSASAGTLGRKDAEKINSRITQSILPAMGFNRNTPLAVVYGPKNIGGIGLKDLFAEQGAAKAAILLKHLRSSSELGKLLKCQLQWAQRAAGIDSPILVDVTSRLPQIKDEVWIQTLREFLALSELGIQVDGVAGIEPKRKSDMAIMSAFTAKVCQLSDNQVIMINRCRTYLRAETIADLCNENGTHIKEIALNCESRARVTKEGKWPRQPRPGEKHQKAWREALKRLCKEGSLELRKPLGKWIATPTERLWPAMYCHERSTVFLLEDKEYEERETHEQGRRCAIVGEEVLDQHEMDNKCTPAECWDAHDGNIMIKVPESWVPPQPKQQWKRDGNT